MNCSASVRIGEGPTLYGQVCSPLPGSHSEVEGGALPGPDLPDLVFQTEKISKSHLAEAVEGRVLLFIRKQEHLDEIMRAYPADHYVMVDDHPQILSDSKRIMKDRLTTVFVKQGHYAADGLPEGFVPDLTLPHIGDLRNYQREQLLQA